MNNREKCKKTLLHGSSRVCAAQLFAKPSEDNTPKFNMIPFSEIIGELNSVEFSGRGSAYPAAAQNNLSGFLII